MRFVYIYEKHCIETEKVKYELIFKKKSSLFDTKVKIIFKTQTLFLQFSLGFESSPVLFKF
jgi:hypothetical protein